MAELVAEGNGALSGHLDGALGLIAESVEPSCSAAVACAELDRLADASTAATASTLAIELFGGVAHSSEVHFVGNHTNYYDINNSLLPVVLERRTGIPITLSVVFMEIARRRGISAHGVGMPGHFLVGSAEGFIDPFHHGVVRDENACRHLFHSIAGPDAAFPAGALDRTPPGRIVQRVLHNIAGAASAANAARGAKRALWAARALLTAFPQASHHAHIQHAYAAAEVGQYDDAAAAGERALVTVPAPVTEKLEAQIIQWRAHLN